MQMKSGQLQQLTSLSHCLKSNKIQMDLSEVENFMMDIITDLELRHKLVHDWFVRAVWYCMCNSNADRSLLISKLYVYFIKKIKKNDTEARELIPIALFLGGVDFQLDMALGSKPIFTPPFHDNVPHQSGVNSISKVGSVEDTHHRKNKALKFIVPAFVIILVCVIFFAIRKPETEGLGGDNSKVSAVELCKHQYSGIIKTNDNTTQYILSFRLEGNILNAVLKKKSNQSSIKVYEARVDKEMLYLDSGPCLQCLGIQKKTPSQLHCNANSGYGEWSFRKDNK